MGYAKRWVCMELHFGIGFHGLPSLSNFYNQLRLQQLKKKPFF
jgi:hypothetical protein